MDLSGSRRMASAAKCSPACRFVRCHLALRLHYVLLDYTRLRVSWILSRRGLGQWCQAFTAYYRCRILDGTVHFRVPELALDTI